MLTIDLECILTKEFWLHNVLVFWFTIKIIIDSLHRRVVKKLDQFSFHSVFMPKAKAGTTAKANFRFRGNVSVAHWLLLTAEKRKSGTRQILIVTYQGRRAFRRCKRAGFLTLHKIRVYYFSLIWRVFCGGALFPILIGNFVLFLINKYLICVWLLFS